MSSNDERSQSSRAPSRTISSPSSSVHMQDMARFAPSFSSPGPPFPGYPASNWQDLPFLLPPGLLPQLGMEMYSTAFFHSLQASPMYSPMALMQQSAFSPSLFNVKDTLKGSTNSSKSESKIKFPKTSNDHQFSGNPDKFLSDLQDGYKKYPNDSSPGSSKAPYSQPLKHSSSEIKADLTLSRSCENVPLALLNKTKDFSPVLISDEGSEHSNENRHSKPNCDQKHESYSFSGHLDNSFNKSISNIDNDKKKQEENYMTGITNQDDNNYATDLTSSKLESSINHTTSSMPSNVASDEAHLFKRTLVDRAEAELVSESRSLQDLRPSITLPPRKRLTRNPDDLQDQPHIIPSSANYPCLTNPSSRNIESIDNPQSSNFRSCWKKFSAKMNNNGPAPFRSMHMSGKPMYDCRLFFQKMSGKDVCKSGLMAKSYLSNMRFYHRNKYQTRKEQTEKEGPISPRVTRSQARQKKTTPEETSEPQEPPPIRKSNRKKTSNSRYDVPEMMTGVGKSRKSRKKNNNQPLEAEEQNAVVEDCRTDNTDTTASFEILSEKIEPVTIPIIEIASEVSSGATVTIFPSTTMSFPKAAPTAAITNTQCTSSLASIASSEDMLRRLENCDRKSTSSGLSTCSGDVCMDAEASISLHPKFRHTKKKSYLAFNPDEARPPDLGIEVPVRSLKEADLENDTVIIPTSIISPTFTSSYKSLNIFINANANNEETRMVQLFPKAAQDQKSTLSEEKALEESDACTTSEKTTTTYISAAATTTISASKITNRTISSNTNSIQCPVVYTQSELRVDAKIDPNTLFLTEAPTLHQSTVIPITVLAANQPPIIPLTSPLQFFSRPTTTTDFSANSITSISSSGENNCACVDRKDANAVAVRALERQTGASSKKEIKVDNCDEALSEYDSTNYMTDQKRATMKMIKVVEESIKMEAVSSNQRQEVQVVNDVAAGNLKAQPIVAFAESESDSKNSEVPKQSMITSTPEEGFSKLKLKIDLSKLSVARRSSEGLTSAREGGSEDDREVLKQVIIEADKKNQKKNKSLKLSVKDQVEGGAAGVSQEGSFVIAKTTVLQRSTSKEESMEGAERKGKKIEKEREEIKASFNCEKISTEDSERLTEEGISKGLSGDEDASRAEENVEKDKADDEYIKHEIDATELKARDVKRRKKRGRKGKRKVNSNAEKSVLGADAMSRTDQVSSSSKGMQFVKKFKCKPAATHSTTMSTDIEPVKVEKLSIDVSSQETALHLPLDETGKLQTTKTDIDIDSFDHHNQDHQDHHHQDHHNQDHHNQDHHHQDHHHQDHHHQDHHHQDHHHQDHHHHRTYEISPHDCNPCDRKVDVYDWNQNDDDGPHLDDMPRFRQNRNKLVLSPAKNNVAVVDCKVQQGGDNLENTSVQKLEEQEVEGVLEMVGGEGIECKEGLEKMEVRRKRKKMKEEGMRKKVKGERTRKKRRMQRFQDSPTKPGNYTAIKNTIEAVDNSLKRQCENRLKEDAQTAKAKRDTMSVKFKLKKIGCEWISVNKGRSAEGVKLEGQESGKHKNRKNKQLSKHSERPISIFVPDSMAQGFVCNDPQLKQAFLDKILLSDFFKCHFPEVEDHTPVVLPDVSFSLTDDPDEIQVLLLTREVFFTPSELEAAFLNLRISTSFKHKSFAPKRASMGLSTSGNKNVCNTLTSNYNCSSNHNSTSINHNNFNYTSNHNSTCTNYNISTITNNNVDMTTKTTGTPGYTVSKDQVLGCTEDIEALFSFDAFDVPKDPKHQNKSNNNDDKIRSCSSKNYKHDDINAFFNNAYNNSHNSNNIFTPPASSLLLLDEALSFCLDYNCEDVLDNMQLINVQ